MISNTKSFKVVKNTAAKFLLEKGISELCNYAAKRVPLCRRST